jgi:hypothetical protein
MYNINKFPIIILSSPRTGSTFLANMLSKSYPDLKLFLEPDETDSMLDFSKYSNINNQYILKFHSRTLFKFPEHINQKIFSNDAFLIRLRRRNIIDQISSLYIELYRNIWNYNLKTVEIYKDEKIIIDNNIINKAIHNTKMYNHSIDTLKINYNLDLYYEDLIEEFGNLSFTYVTPKPINHNEIYQAIQNQLG